MTEISKLTQEQLEQNLSHKVKVLYLTQLGHQPYKVSCQLVEKTLTIIIEDSITRLEQLLAKNGKQELAKQVRLNIHQAIEPNLKSLIEEVVKSSVINIFSDSAFDTRRTSLVAILATALEEEIPANAAQVKQETVLDGDNDG